MAPEAGRRLSHPDGRPPDPELDSAEGGRLPAAPGTTVQQQGALGPGEARGRGPVQDRQEDDQGDGRQAHGGGERGGRAQGLVRH